MAPKAEQTELSPTITSTKKSSIWKRRLGKGNKQKSAAKSSSAAASSPTTVTAMPMVAVTVNGITTCAVAADANNQEEPPLPHESSPLMETTKSKYIMQDNNNDNNNSTASYFNSFISRHQLSFSEEESSEGNGLVIQEVMQTSYGSTTGGQQSPNWNEKWTPFATDEEEDVAEDGPVGNVGKPSSSPNENVITEKPKDSSQQQSSSQPGKDDAMFQVKKVDGSSSQSNNNNKVSIHEDGNSSPLADPPSTQRKTLTPEFFLGSGSNNKNNTTLQQQKNGRKRLDTTSTTKNTKDNNNTTTNSKRETIHHNNIQSSSNISTTSSSQEGHNMYAEIYIRRKQPKQTKQQPYPPPPSTMGGHVPRDRSALSSNTNPSLDMTAVSSLSGRSSMFGTIHAQENGCCTTSNHPMPMTPDACEMMDYDDGDGGDEKEYNYFEYDANADAPLSPLGVEPKRELDHAMFISKNTHGGSTSRNNNPRKSTANPSSVDWKSRVNSIWSSVSKHTCRCFGEPFSNDNEKQQQRDGSKWKVSSATTAATSTTGANTSAAMVRKMNQTPMFSTPVKEAGTFD
mmetsp:Transcript_22064/g.36061  ORF Transcript_22064/g.36061 Transcript_22064/m.36061 type:complete len:569 (-) Transcript_22064:272-1978(-)